MVTNQPTKQCRRCEDIRRRRFCSHSCYIESRTRDVAERFWEKVDTSSSGCWLWNRGNCKGYGNFSLPGNKRQHSHRVAYELTYGPIPDGLVVCHSCDNPPCVRPDHLFLGTYSDNMRDAAAKGRLPRGDTHSARTRPETRARGMRHGNRKLTETDVRHIRREYSNGSSTISLSHRFGVCLTTIKNVVSRKIWRHV